MQQPPVTPFRVEHRSAAEASAEGLERELQRRLRVLAFLWALFAVALAAAGLASNWQLFLDAPLEGLLTPPAPGLQLLVALAGSGIVVALAPARRASLGLLRTVEVILVGAVAAFMGWSLVQNLRGEVRDGVIGIAPIDLATSHASYWGGLIVAAAVLVPTTWRHGVIRAGAIVVFACLTPAFVFAGTTSFVPKVSVYLGVYVFVLLNWTALALYGTYRVAVLRHDVQEARKLGQYVLREKLGGGGMGEVYRAEHHLLRRPCAVKLIHPEQAGDARTLARFEREVQATAALTHPNTVQIYDYGRADDGTFYYVMEYLPGESLDALVAREGPLEPGRAVHVMVQLCGALAEAHGQGLIHRDIKPGNVIVGERGGMRDVVKLLDFGLVAPVAGQISGAPADASRLTQAGMVLGTPEYMSPEQCSGDTDVGVASDVYALGALTYFLLVGHSPFAGRGPMQMIAAHLMEAPRPLRELNPAVPGALEAVVMQCLAKEPAERVADVRSLAVMLEGAVASAPRWRSQPEISAG